MEIPKELVVVAAQGMFIVGKTKRAGRLEKPRILTITDNGSKIHLTPLPGVPGFMYIPADTIMYPVPSHDKNIKKLYEQVTAAGVDPN